MTLAGAERHERAPAIAEGRHAVGDSLDCVGGGGGDRAPEPFERLLRVRREAGQEGVDLGRS